MDACKLVDLTSTLSKKNFTVDENPQEKTVEVIDSMATDIKAY